MMRMSQESANSRHLIPQVTQKLYVDMEAGNFQHPVLCVSGLSSP